MRARKDHLLEEELEGIPKCCTHFETMATINKQNKPNLTENEHKAVTTALSLHCSKENGMTTLHHGAQTTVAQQFGVAQSTISRIWKRALKSEQDPDKKAFRASPLKKGRSGRPRLYDRE